ncbi:MAG: iron chelate uptake ABC transporter family permease subunit, partial [Psychrobacillus psychrotolerans]
MMKTSIHFSFKFAIGLILLLMMFCISMVFGAASTSLQDVWQALFSHVKSDSINILRELRLPREVAAMLVGAA